MAYQIFDSAGNIINTIIADQNFVDTNYPGQYQYISDPIVLPPEPEKTEEQKIADAVAAAVAKLIADGVLKQT